MCFADCRRHCQSKKHKRLAEGSDRNQDVGSFFLPERDLRPIRAETLFSSFIVEHNIALKVTDHAGPLFRRMFPDSEIARQYSAGKTKTTCIINTLARDDSDRLTEVMKKAPFSLATDGSTDMDDVKMYPIAVKIFDASVGKVVLMLLKLCESRESTGKAIFDLVDNVLKEKGIPWSNCVSFAADNAAVMQGLGKGVAAFLKAQQPNIYLVGCACHLIHIAAERASRELTVDVEEFLMSIYYYHAFCCVGACE